MDIAATLVQRLGLTPDDGVVIVYDGDCIFCSEYVRMVRLKESAGRVHMLSARENGRADVIASVTGLDLNEGMLAIYGGRIYYGAEAVHALALLTSPTTMFNRVNAALLRHRGIASFSYPFLKAGRNLTLALRGKKQIELSRAG